MKVTKPKGEGAPAESSKAWTCARKKSKRRAMRVKLLAPLAVIDSLPKSLLSHSTLASPTLGLANCFVMITDVVEACTQDVRGMQKGNPILICGNVDGQSGDLLDDIAKELASSRQIFTYGYELEINIKWAARIASDGRLTEDPDCIKDDVVLRCSKHVYKVVKKVTAAQGVILLCNSGGTALAIGSEIPDPALVRTLQGILAEANGRDGDT